MKKYFRLILLTLVFAVSSCKKEMEVNVDKTYIEVGATASSLGFGGIILTLMPDGKADFLNSGDIVERMNYRIKGDRVILSDDQKTEFKVISDTELSYDGNRILRLSVK